MREGRPKTYLEIGLGALRFRGYGNAFPFAPGDRYLAVDLRSEIGAMAAKHSLPVCAKRGQLEQAMRDGQIDTLVGVNIALNMQSIEEFAKAHDITFTPVYADGRSLPLADHSVEQALLSNIIGDPSITLEDKSQLIAEARRVVGPEGLVVVRDDYTPYVADEYFNSAAESPLLALTAGDDTWPIYAAKYNADHHYGRLFLLGQADILSLDETQVA